MTCAVEGCTIQHIDKPDSGDSKRFFGVWPLGHRTLKMAPNENVGFSGTKSAKSARSALPLKGAD